MKLLKNKTKQAKTTNQPTKQTKTHSEGHAYKGGLQKVHEKHEWQRASFKAPPSLSTVVLFLAWQRRGLCPATLPEGQQHRQTPGTGEGGDGSKWLLPASHWPQRHHHLQFFQRCWAFGILQKTFSSLSLSLFFQIKQRKAGDKDREFKLAIWKIASLRQSLPFKILPERSAEATRHPDLRGRGRLCVRPRAGLGPVTARHRRPEGRAAGRQSPNDK